MHTVLLSRHDGVGVMHCGVTNAIEVKDVLGSGTFFAHWVIGRWFHVIVNLGCFQDLPLNYTKKQSRQNLKLVCIYYLKRLC